MVLKRKLERVDDNDDEFSVTMKRAAEFLHSITGESEELEEDSEECINQDDRMGFYHILKNCTSREEYYALLKLSSRISEFALAIAFNDSPEDLRLEALKNLSCPLRRARILDLIAKIQSESARFDPYRLFPIVLTKKHGLTGAKCNRCDGGFMEASNCVWKNCGRHILHSKCLSEAALFGLCDCLNGS